MSQEKMNLNLVLVLALVLSFSAGTLPRPASVTAANGDADLEKARADYGQMNVIFEENRGQTDERVKFFSRSGGLTTFLTSDAVWFVLPVAESYAGTRQHRDAETETADQVGNPIAAIRNPKSEIRNQKAWALQMKIEGANPQASVAGENELAGRVNYFRGNDSAKWQSDVKTFGGVRYEGIYEGVDLVYYGNRQREMEYDFRVEPEADVGQISLRFEGADSVEVAASGDLIIKTPAGELRQQKPAVYQETNGERHLIASGYSLEGDGRVHFSLGEYDASRTLVIDPVLSYSTFLGGSGDLDQSNSIAIDSSGNAYVTGTTNSINFPTTPGGFDPTINSGIDGFVTKLNAAGSALVYSTYLGGGDLDFGENITIDSSGNAYVTGTTLSTNFPTTQGAFDTTYGGIRDGFVTKLNAAGSALVYSTYLGGSDFDEAYGIEVDSSGNAYVTGTTKSTDFPTTPGAFDTTINGGFDGFVTKLNAAGSALVYSTFLGGSTDDVGNSITIDSSGNAYGTGYTNSTAFPTTPGAFDTTYNGGITDGFVTKLNAAGSALVYSTYLGGSGSTFDFGTGVTVDSSGNAHVTGFTLSSDFPTTPGAFDTTYGGIRDGFVTKLNAAGSALVYSTYLGGSNTTEAYGIEVDSSGNAYVTGGTFATDFPTTPGAFDTTINGGFDGFVTKLNAAGSALVYSTFLGGSTDDSGSGLAIDSSGNAYVTGFTTSTAFPTTPGAFDTTYNGGFRDGFVTKLNTAPTAQFDFDGDGRTDISVWRPSDGNWHLSQSTAGYASYTWGASGDQIVPLDFDGDDKADVAVWRPSTGTWYILNSNGGTYSSYTWGASGDVPVVGDYDDDGKADVAVYRAAGQWFILKSSGGTQTSTWGAAGDVPVAGDFDGDGQSDIAVRRSSTGEWFINRSTAGYVSVTWGVSTDIPVHADYDGDQKGDVAVWRPSTGEWFILRSSDGGYTNATWGASGDVPVPGDYDGDGKADISVVRNGVWHIDQSTAGYRTATWGIGTDIAIPGRY